MQIRMNSRRMCLIVTLAMVITPLIGATPALAQGFGLVTDVHNAQTDDLYDYQIDPNTMAPTACGVPPTNWVVSSSITCTGETISVRSINVQAGATLTLDAGTTLNMATTSTYDWSCYIYVYGTLKVMNSTIKSGTAGYYFYMIQMESATSVFRSQGSSISGGYYGLYTWNGGKLYINKTTFSGMYYYGSYISMANGYITNSTFSGPFGSGWGYGLMAQNLMNFKINNNTFKNNPYGGYFYSYNGELYDNTFQSNSQYGLYIYGSTPNMANNRFISNSQAGIYSYSWQQSSWTMTNCTFTGNGRDIDLESGGGNNELNSINSKFTNVVVDQNGWGGQSKLNVYWYTNTSVKWLGDNKPAANVTVEVEDKTGGQYPAGALMTDTNGKINWVPMMEYTQTKTGKVAKSPYWVNATGTWKGRDIKNFTKMDISQNGQNKAELYLDNVPPSLLITSPPNNMLTNQTNITIKGWTERNVDRANRPVLVTVKLGGTSYSPIVDINGYFEQGLTLPKEGNNSFDITACDWVLNCVKTTQTVKRDTINPPLTVSAPNENTLTNQTTITVNGTSEPNAKLWVNFTKPIKVGKIVAVDKEGVWTTQVALTEGSNLIEVKVMDAALNWVTETRTIRLDTKAPLLMVSEPLDGYRTNDRNLRVSGITEAGSRVFVNGAPVAVGGTTYQASVQLSEGVNHLNFDAVDMAGNHNYTVVTVTLKTVPPKLEITMPTKNNVLTNSVEISLQGYVEPGSTMWINKEQKDYSGDWSCVLSLKEGKNKITVEAMDDVGNRVMIGRTVVRDTMPPMLAVFNPQDKMIVTDDNVSVEGSVEPGASLTVNGKVTSTIGGVFTTMVKLKEGGNAITLVATDAAGNSNTEVRHVIMDTFVNLTLDTSLNGKTVKNSNITLTGKTDPGATVYINGESIRVKVNGDFTASINLLEGNNTIKVQAVDEHSNTKGVDMWVVLKSPTNTGQFGSTGASTTNILIWVLVIALLVGAVGAIAGHSAYSRKKQREAEMKAQQEKDAEKLRKESPSNIYQQLYGQPEQQAYPSGPEGQATYGTATAVPSSDLTMTGGSPEMVTRLDDVENKVRDAELQGVSGVDARRNLRLARQFAARGNSEKAEYYAEKALDSIGQNPSGEGPAQ